MGYRDDFYVSGNIIGYTGDLNNKPTVYFQSGKTFGRITQDHPHPDNIGRNVVRTRDDYSIGNTGPQGQCQEFYDGAVRHTSRNPFTAVSDSNRATLAQAITDFPNQKDK